MFSALMALLLFASIHIYAQEIKPNDTTEQRYNILNEVVVSPSRVSESILQSPVSIEKMSYQAIKEVPSLSFYEGLQSLKGMEMYSVGLGIKMVNTRGFNGTSNARFLQLIDGVDNQPPGLNFPMGNLFGVSDIDMESAELIPGAASALYGPAAFNGMLTMHTKDPFKYQGLSLHLKAGANHFGETVVNPQPLYDVAARYAKSFLNDKLAFKVNVGYFKGRDWYATDYSDISAQTPPDKRGPGNPGRDGLNIYGDEVSRTLPGIGLVSRTGYEEKDLMNYNTYSLKTNAAIHYKFNENLRIIYQYNRAQAIAAFTSSARMNLNQFVLQTHRIELRSKNSFIRAYSSAESLEAGYNARTLGQFINRYWVRDFNGDAVSPQQADNVWFNRYASAFNGGINGVTSNDHSAARTFADEGRFLPGSAPFNEAKETLRKKFGNEGAGIFSNNKFYHAEGQFDLTDAVKVVEVLVGGSFRFYDMFTNGTLLDDKENKVTIKEYGTFVQAVKRLLNDKLKLTASLRFDKNENFKGSFTPRFSGVYTVSQVHNFRASFQTGFRNPTPIDQYIKLNAGPITVLGGAPNNSRGMNVYENSFTAASVGQFSSAYGTAVGSGSTQEEAIAANKHLLQKSAVPYIGPEKQIAFEIGYKGIINNKLLIDINYYRSSYSNFILNAVVVRPQNSVLSNGEINTAAAADLLNGQSQSFQLYTNAADKAIGEGATLGLTYNLPKGYTIGGNVTWSSFTLGDANVNNIAPFNTPRWSTNMTLGNTNVYKNFGFNIAWHWQDAFYWYGPFIGMRPGPVNAYSLVDFQINKKLPQHNAMIKIGASNALNNHVITAYGSPTIGAVYYVAYTIDELFK